MLANELVWVRGAGELGSGVAHLLHRVGLHVFMSDLAPPLAIRRPVTFSCALVDGSTVVEGVEAKKTQSQKLNPSKPWKHIPLFEDNPEKLLKFRPTVLIDARMLKKYKEDFRPWADLVIGLGPGFEVGKNCHLAIETMRGHNLGRIISKGAPLADSGIPGNIGGETTRRLIRATRTGQMKWATQFGELVSKGQQLALINNDKPVFAPLDGMVRGMISEHTPVVKGMKIGDIDPRGESVEYKQISEKARTIAAGVFEAIVLHHNEISND
ncbi:MAG: EF2563 family selenium-dependent molybdenum hydroxylase system protein [Candidatus Marinimicrobia bacterium]|jgi:xanthine dehydrogenase accessory factor|nr:EF2563 family selenium-dependent molybdenum hydroxylase system protein [Candidatus Neomarinimicrobiota bacterium]MBT4251830.1 EF2563 family selenium-dependent molybdenum hydroxylase system protein [Candidatus Neomarinimicrobiota bacterium]MBT5787412.1 EF2563 family selenium-dependent molybdenum hydroxylase system protein [Candidatus Neomarinimicrobiota bacterium]MBT6303838.1 EF2563 family selenium-dependent molybdenum hydroxylase system protein [Candidatus Neomarinimicrobiota bacterium]MBT69